VTNSTPPLEQRGEHSRRSPRRIRREQRPGALVRQGEVVRILDRDVQIAQIVPIDRP
jgi:hypothetical protein